MRTVMTVLGPITTDQLGQTLMHEHIYSSSIGIPENYPQLYVEGVDEQVQKDLAAMKADGFQTVVEATPFDLGRDPVRLKLAAQKSGMNIIACTGFFEQPHPLLGDYSADRFASLFVDDLQKGMAGTDIKAGIIKTAMDKEGPTPGRELIHRAVARAALQTGARVMLHSYPQTEMGRHQIRIFKEEGVPLSQIKIDHCLETTDMDYLCWLADQGVWLGVDRIPLIIGSKQYAVAAETRVRTIKRMLDAGLAERMLLSHDFMSTSTYYDHLPVGEAEFVAKLNPLRFSYLTQEAFRKIGEMGGDVGLLWKILRENPKRFFEGA